MIYVNIFANIGKRFGKTFVAFRNIDETLTLICNNWPHRSNPT